jgi:hypothetical protein
MEADRLSSARLVYMTSSEYADRWRQVWDVFSREAVWGGSLDQFVQTRQVKRGTSEVDVELLTEIEGCRNILARNIAFRNPDLTNDELNDAVQHTMDCILFLRVLEDRGMEPYGRLQRLAGGGDLYPELIKLCRQADDRYNSGLFGSSKASGHAPPQLTIDDKALQPILSDLSYPQSPY